MQVPSASPFASVAQVVEQGTENPRVAGSIPAGGTISPVDTQGIHRGNLSKAGIKRV